MFRLIGRQAMRITTVVFFFIIYSLVIFFMAYKVQLDCPLAQDIARELGSYDFEKRIHSNQQEIRHSSKVELSFEPYYVNDRLEVNEILERDLIPSTVYYVWCGKRWFEFPHYLSVLSVMKNIRPDSFVFFYNVYPVNDSWMYNTWLNELKERFPFFRTHPLEPQDDACKSHAVPNLDFVKRIISRNGGIYVNELTIITSLPKKIRKFNVINALDEKTGHGFLMAKRNFLEVKDFKERSKEKKIQCIHWNNYTSQTSRRTSCIYLTSALYPKDIWYLDNAFGRLTRSLFYGTSKIRTPIPSNQTLVPNIAHVVWLGGGPMDFLFLLCVLSLLNVAKVEALYLHGDGPPTGPYWDLVKDHERLHLVYRDYPGTIYGTTVNVWSHITDIWRVDFMIKYGGIYVDTDTVFVKPLDERIRSYDAVATYDWTYWNHPFPDTINFGVSIGKRNAKYWHLFQESMKVFVDTDWSWNGLRQPYKVLERHPDLILIDPYLSVICFQSLCHPTWWPNYHNESIHHLNSNSIPNWRENIYAFHWTLPTPYELHNHTTLFATSTMFSEIAKYVLQQSNFLQHFKQMVSKEKNTHKQALT